MKSSNEIEGNEEKFNQKLEEYNEMIHEKCTRDLMAEGAMTPASLS